MAGPGGGRLETQAVAEELVGRLIGEGIMAQTPSEPFAIMRLDLVLVLREGFEGLVQFGRGGNGGYP